MYQRQLHLISALLMVKRTERDSDFLYNVSSRETGGSEPLATASGTALLGALGGCSFEHPTAAVSKSSYKMCA